MDDSGGVGGQPFDGEYEPWLFRAMLDELSVSELGVGFIYTLLDKVAERHALRDVVVVVTHDTIGVQAFRRGGRAVSAAQLDSLGVETAVHSEPDVVPASERDAVRTACELALSLHLARFSASHDPLTNIANRRSFDAALQMATARTSRYGWTFALVMIDLNGFKAVNDRYGHEVGDGLLRQFGFALRRSVRDGDTAARFGGDEFAVILSQADGHDVTGFADRLRTQMKASGAAIDFTFGAATAPNDSVDPVELVRVADARLYEAKGARRP